MALVDHYYALVAGTEGVACSATRALRQLRREALAGRFDLQLVEGFIDAVDPYPIGRQVVLNTGEHGEVLLVRPRLLPGKEPSHTGTQREPQGSHSLRHALGTLLLRAGPLHPNPGDQPGATASAE